MIIFIPIFFFKLPLYLIQYTPPTSLYPLPIAPSMGWGWRLSTYLCLDFGCIDLSCVGSPVMSRKQRFLNTLPCYLAVKYFLSPFPNVPQALVVWGSYRCPL